MKHEFMVNTWGGFYNEEYQKIHGLLPGYYWFDTLEERETFKRSRKAIEAEHNARVLCFSEVDGPECRLRTIAHMDFIYKGIRYSYSYDFGYGYPEESAEYMFTEGNYACDCNRSLFLMRAYGVNIEELNCGDEITMENFRVERVAGSNAAFELKD